MNSIKNSIRNIKKKGKKKEGLEPKLRDWILKRKRNKIKIDIK
jgi:hypothetical protein